MWPPLLLIFLQARVKKNKLNTISVISLDWVEDNGGKIQGARATHNLENLTNLRGGINM